MAAMGCLLRVTPHDSHPRLPNREAHIAHVCVCVFVYVCACARVCNLNGLRRYLCLFAAQHPKAPAPAAPNLSG